MADEVEAALLGVDGAPTFVGVDGATLLVFVTAPTVKPSALSTPLSGFALVVVGGS